MSKLRNQKRVVETLLRHYQKLLKLDHWTIDLVISKDENDGNGAAAICNPQWQYESAVITVFQCSFKPPNDIHDFIKHELAHCITQPLYESGMDLLSGKLVTHRELQDQREIMTERISKLIPRKSK